jgi:hypothetical protein
MGMGDGGRERNSQGYFAIRLESHKFLSSSRKAEKETHGNFIKRDVNLRREHRGTPNPRHFREKHHVRHPLRKLMIDQSFNTTKANDKKGNTINKSTTGRQ